MSNLLQERNLEWLIDEEATEEDFEFKLSKSQKRLARLIAGDQGGCVLIRRPGGKVQVFEPKDIMVITK